MRGESIRLERSECVRGEQPVDVVTIHSGGSRLDERHSAVIRR